MLSWRQLTAASALLSVGAVIWVCLPSMNRVDPADQNLIEILNGERLESTLIMNDFNGGIVSVRMPRRVTNDLRALILGPQWNMEPKFLRASAPLAMIEVSSNSGIRRLEWHVDLIVDPKGDFSRMWTGPGPRAMTQTDLEISSNVRDVTYLTTLAAAWEKAIAD